MAGDRGAGCMAVMTATATAPQALVVYASTHGHTAKIAARIAESMREQGLDVDLRDVEHAAAAAPDEYDVVVVATSLHAEHHQPEMIEWVKTHRDALDRIPTTFLSVSLTAAEDSDAARRATQGWVDVFCEDTGWTPGRTECIPGALQYREYNVFTRHLMRLLMKRMGHDTDASHDHDYTDWNAVDRLGREIASLARVHVA